MSSDLTLVNVERVAKCYQIYAQPQDRLKQAFHRRMRRILPLADRQFFREFWALRDVSFSVGRGETVGILGRNGSGKSTLLQMLSGQLQPSAGQVSYRMRDGVLRVATWVDTPDAQALDDLVRLRSVANDVAQHTDLVKAPACARIAEYRVKRHLVAMDVGDD